MFPSLCGISLTRRKDEDRCYLRNRLDLQAPHHLGILASSSILDGPSFKMERRVVTDRSREADSLEHTVARMSEAIGHRRESAKWSTVVRICHFCAIGL